MYCRQAQWKKASPDRAKAIQRAAKARLRLLCLAHYGRSCECCSENRFEFLAIDHINNGGNRQRELVGSGHLMYSWLRRNQFPAGYRVACHNCNSANGAYGTCPHSIEELET